jgi:hypothetical protein
MANHNAPNESAPDLHIWDANTREVLSNVTILEHLTNWVIIRLVTLLWPGTSLVSYWPYQEVQRNRTSL